VIPRGPSTHTDRTRRLIQSATRPADLVGGRFVAASATGYGPEPGDNRRVTLPGSAPSMRLDQRAAHAHRALAEASPSMARHRARPATPRPGIGPRTPRPRSRYADPVPSPASAWPMPWRTTRGGESGPAGASIRR
jgi:hypothetical protein